MDWVSVASSFIGAGVGGALFVAYFEHRLSRSREVEAEQRRRRAEKRDAAAAVVEILGEWVRTTYLGQDFDGEARWRLQTTYWRNILLLDIELLELLTRRLANVEEAPDTNEIIVQARRILLELPEADVKASDLNVWNARDPGT